MSDNITLPREVVERVETLMKIANRWSDDVDILVGLVADLRDDLTDLRAALAAPKQEQEFVAVVGMQEDSWKLINSRWVPPGMPFKAVQMLRDLPLGTPLYAAPPEDIEALTATRDRQAAMLRRFEERETELDAEIGLLRRENERLVKENDSLQTENHRLQEEAELWKSRCEENGT